jgi:NAD(P)-dependent dehydrogenase (short-subunit alcohol dehydrogenase family)
MGERLNNKVAIVTGAGSVGHGWGNGKATAVLFAREGAKVFATDINLAAAEETKAIIDQEGGMCTVCQADVAKADDVKAMIEQCLTTYGRLIFCTTMLGSWWWVDLSKPTKRPGIG